MDIRTCESTCVGHPDKLCDLIADTILDDLLFEDPSARCAVEVMATKGRIIVAGEITSSARVRVRESVRRALIRAGYAPFGWRVNVHTHSQSPDIAAGVNTSLEARGGEESAYVSLGAGDQGTVYGYATRETSQRLPLPLVVAHDMCRRLDKARTEGTIRGIGCDGKAQVSLRYEDGQAVGVEAVVVSIQHMKDTDLEELRRTVRTQVIAPALARHDLHIDEDTLVLVNPAGPFTLGGPAADTGLSGRKLAVDTYGGLAPHGGGAFSGKDATKVDRSGAYMARLIAETIVDAHLADEAVVALSYAIGKADPVAVSVDSRGTGIVADEVLAQAVRAVFDLRPEAIIEQLRLRQPLFAEHATYGHFTKSSRWNHFTLNTQELREAVEARANRNTLTW
ncbi:methionine adenosyltransferase [Corynebacterium auriscanis]|uniref:methionine adenosyltransferase n=1 Tax=Corynebacterium auriscanis TaxID=99807 RepID=UPI003CF91F04